MSFIDIAILAIVVLCGLWGVLKGVKKSALSLGAFILAFALAFFLANVIAEALLGVDNIKAFVIGNGFGDDAHWSLAKWINENNTKPEPQSYLFENFYKPMADIVEKGRGGVDADQAFAIYGAFVMFSAMCGVGIFIVSRFLLTIVTAIIKTYIGKKKTVMSRLFGFVVGGMRGAIWAFAFTVVFSCFGGYSFFIGFKNIEAEYENNAVVSKYFNDGAYGMRNYMFLPDSDTCGRLVNMVFGKGDEQTDTDEPLSGHRLELWVNLSNLNYDNSPHTIDANRHRQYDSENANARSGDSFTQIGFDVVAQAILDYNQEVADIVDNVAKMKDVTENEFGLLDGWVKPDGSGTTINGLMDELWRQLRNYNEHLANPNQEEEVSQRNSTLETDYTNIRQTISKIKEKYDAFKGLAKEESLNAFPTLTLPAAKKFKADGTIETVVSGGVSAEVGGVA